MNDKRIVLTLDAGGTNLYFSALQDGKPIVEPIVLKAHADNKEKALNAIIEGFEKLKDQLNEVVSAISFAFPGPADYPNGIIYNVGNLPAFAGGVALGPLLKRHFNFPVFINNDADLFAYGEAIQGVLPSINQQLKEAGSPKRFNNLLGLTLGTGFGAGIVRNKELFLGDNSNAAEIWLVRNHETKSFAEESLSIRAILREYKSLSKDNSIDLSPKCIFEIAKGLKNGNQTAAIESYHIFGKALGECIANAVTLIDGIVVIGGGLSGAAEFFLPSALDVLNGKILSIDGKEFPRLVQKVFNLDNKDELNQFLKGDTKELEIYGSSDTIKVDPLSRIGICLSKLGTNEATAIGAYTYAINQLDK